MSQSALAAAAQMHVTYLSGCERGRRNPTLTTIARIAQGLEVNIIELFKPVGAAVPYMRRPSRAAVNEHHI